MCESQKTSTERALINFSDTSETRNLTVSSPSKDQDIGSTLGEDKCSAPNLTKTLFAFVLIIEVIEKLFALEPA